MKKFPIPILLIIFNRPNQTKLVFEQIRQIQPEKLMIAGDGPRKNKPKDQETVHEARKQIKVDWDCDVTYLYQEGNLGVALNPYKAIRHFFSTYAYGIVLEDDCLPEQSFFPFVEQMLRKYKDDERIGMISGTNPYAFPTEESYIFTRHGLSLGWASWSRAWKHYDFNLTQWPEMRRKKLLKDIFSNPLLRMHWHEYYNRVYGGNNDAWDYQWSFARFKNNYLTIRPRVNLISNTGFTEDATHSKKAPNKKYLQSSSVQFPLKHPSFVIPHGKTDRRIEKPWKRVMFSKLFSNPLKYIPIFLRYL